MIRTTLALSSLTLIAGCADSQHGTYASNASGANYGENRSVNNWGTATPRVESNQWNRSATTTVGPNGIERRDQDRTWSNNDNYNNRNNSDSNSGTYNSNNQNRSSNNWTSNEPNRTDAGMSRSDSQYEQNRQSNNSNYDQNHSESPSSSNQNYTNQNQINQQGQKYTNDNTRRDNMRVTPSQGDNQFGQNASANSVDAFFGKCAMGLNSFEIEAGELAIQRTKNEQVKTFAQMMVDNHKKAQSELDTIVRQGNWNTPSQLNSSHSELLNYLRQLDDQQFDSEYMSAMAAGHAAAVSMFKDKAKTLQTSELRSWTERQVSGLEKHLESARSINDRIRPR